MRQSATSPVHGSAISTTEQGAKENNAIANDAIARTILEARIDPDGLCANDILSEDQLAELYLVILDALRPATDRAMTAQTEAKTAPPS